MYHGALSPLFGNTNSHLSRIDYPPLAAPSVFQSSSSTPTKDCRSITPAITSYPHHHYPLYPAQVGVEICPQDFFRVSFSVVFFGRARDIGLLGIKDAGVRQYLFANQIVSYCLPHSAKKMVSFISMFFFFLLFSLFFLSRATRPISHRVGRSVGPSVRPSHFTFFSVFVLFEG